MNLTEQYNIPKKALGVTGALRFDEHNAFDSDKTQKLLDVLIEEKVFERHEETEQRYKALRRLNSVAGEWVKNKAEETGITSYFVHSKMCKIFTFGSFRLGVNNPGADIDALIVAPRFVTRENFFTEFPDFVSTNCSVEDICAVRDAYVPLLKMKLLDVEIDLLFASLDSTSVPEHLSLIQNEEILLKNLDERDIRSLNGVRVTEEILSCVYRVPEFKSVLRAIRLWARRRGIYGNSLGFFGGVTWAIMVARVCQLFPTSKPNILVWSFFKVFARWSWPKPVLLKPTERIESLNYPVWDSMQNQSDFYHLLPVITPAYPAQNSTYNVCQSNKTIILREIKRGLDVVEGVMGNEKMWGELLEPVNFFTYRHYILVACTNTEKEGFTKLCGLVESRLRHLVNLLDSMDEVELAHVNTKSYDRCKDSEPTFYRKWFVGLKFRPTPDVINTPTTLVNNIDPQAKRKLQTIDLSYYITQFKAHLFRSNNNEIERFELLTVQHVLRKDLGNYLPREELDVIKALCDLSRKRCLQASNACPGTTAATTGATTGTTASSTGCNGPDNNSEDTVSSTLATTAGAATTEPILKLPRTKSTESALTDWAESTALAQNEEEGDFVPIHNEDKYDTVYGFHVDCLIRMMYFYIQPTSTTESDDDNSRLH